MELTTVDKMEDNWFVFLLDLNNVFESDISRSKSGGRETSPVIKTDPSL